MKKPWDQMTDEEKQDEVVDLNDVYRIASEYISFLEGLLDKLAEANAHYLETVQTPETPEQVIYDATTDLLEVVAEVVDKHTAEYEPREPD